MAFTPELVARYPASNGAEIVEIWTWDADSVTTGVITPSSTDPQGIGLIKEITEAHSTVTSTDAALRLTYNSNVLPTSVTVTCTADSVGRLTLRGVAR